MSPPRARAQHLIEQYDGAPAVQDALDIMIESYRKLGLTDLQTNVEHVYETNYQRASAQNAPKKVVVAPLVSARARAAQLR